MHIHRSLLAGIAVALCLLLTACTTSQVVTSLTTITSVLEIALPVVLSAIGNKTLTDAQKAAVTTYFDDVATAVQQTAAELETSDTPAVKAAQIAGFFAAAVAPDVTGLPATIATAVKSLSAIISAYLTQYNKASVRYGDKTVAIPGKVGLRDRYRLHELSNRAEKVHQRLILVEVGQ